MFISPAILAKNKEDFFARLRAGKDLPKTRWHIDILDGTKYEATCWHASEELKDVALPECEIHLMVHNPLPHIETWQKNVQTLTRVLLEASCPTLEKNIAFAKHMHLNVSLVLNPADRPDMLQDGGMKDLSSLDHMCDEIVCMGIHPGASGQVFLGERILANIERTRALFSNVDIALDGGITPHTMKDIAKSGVTRAITASALFKTGNPKEAWDILQDASKIML